MKMPNQNSKISMIPRRNNEASPGGFVSRLHHTDKSWHGTISCVVSFLVVTVRDLWKQALCKAAFLLLLHLFIMFEESFFVNVA